MIGLVSQLLLYFIHNTFHLLHLRGQTQIFDLLKKSLNINGLRIVYLSIIAADWIKMVVGSWWVLLEFMLQHFWNILHGVLEELILLVAFSDILDGFLAITKDFHCRVDDRHFFVIARRNAAYRPLWVILGCIPPSQVLVKTSTLGIEMTDSFGHEGVFDCQVTLHHLFRFFWCSQIPLAPRVLSSRMVWSILGVCRLLHLNGWHSRSIRTEKQLLGLHVLVLEIVVIYLQQGSFCIHL